MADAVRRATHLLALQRRLLETQKAALADLEARRAELVRSLSELSKVFEDDVQLRGRFMQQLAACTKRMRGDLATIEAALDEQRHALMESAICERATGNHLERVAAEAARGRARQDLLELLDGLGGGPAQACHKANGGG